MDECLEETVVVRESKNQDVLDQMCREGKILKREYPRDAVAFIDDDGIERVEPGAVLVFMCP